MNLLDQVIDSTQGRVFRVENDLSKINAQAALFDEAELGKMYSREQIEAMRNDPSRQKEAVEAAIARASLDTKDGKICVMVNVGPNGEKLPWHQLGTMVTGVVTSAEARQLAGLGWLVKVIPAQYSFGGEHLPSLDTRFIIRGDDGTQLGVTGTRYQPIQNSDAFDFLDDVLKDFGGARYETAGSIYGGKMVWMQCTLPESSWEVRNGDAIETYAMFAAYHDGVSASKCFPVTERAVCANTFRTAVNSRDKGIILRHTGNIKAKIQQAKNALRLSVEGFGRFKEASQEMLKVKLAQPNNFVVGVLDKVLDVTQEQVSMGAELLASHKEWEVKKAEAEIEKYRTVFDDIITRHDSVRCEPHGTLWGVFNAITESADHRKVQQRGETSVRLARKFESVLVGDADNMKQVAYQAATQLLAN